MGIGSLRFLFCFRYILCLPLSAYDLTDSLMFIFLARETPVAVHLPTVTIVDSS